MAFPTEQTPTIDGRGAVAITFYIPDPDIPDDVQSGRLAVQVKWSNGEVRERTYDLLVRLGDDSDGQNIHLPALQALKSYILARIDSEILT